MKLNYIFHNELGDKNAKACHKLPQLDHVVGLYLIIRY